MGMIRRADAEQMAREAVVLDLSRLEQQREALVESARLEAEQIIAEAQAERKRIVSGAAEDGRKAGFAEGRKTGLEKGRAEGRAEAVAEYRAALDQLTGAWLQALEQFIIAREQMLQEARTDVVRLACQIATRATGRIVEAEPAVVAQALGEVLSLVSARTTLRVRVHPDDVPVLEAATPELLARFESQAHIELLHDAASARGTCVAVTEGNGIIDASVQTRLDRIVADILGQEEAA